MGEGLYIPKGIIEPRKNLEGVLITLEGPEGSGKSTQNMHICRYLAKKGYPHVSIREPGGTLLANSLRALLLDKATEGISARTELMMMEAARSDLIERIVIPALEKGYIVLTDRDYHSTIAYQYGGRGEDFEIINILNYYATYGIVPDLVLILKLSAEEGLKRAGRTGVDLDRIELAGMEFHNKVVETYQRMKELLHHENIVYIDALKEPEEVFKQIKKPIDEILRKKFKQQTRKK